MANIYLASHILFLFHLSKGSRYIRNTYRYVQNISNWIGLEEYTIALILFPASILFSLTKNPKTALTTNIHN